MVTQMLMLIMAIAVSFYKEHLCLEFVRVIL